METGESFNGVDINVSASGKNSFNVNFYTIENVVDTCQLYGSLIFPEAAKGGLKFEVLLSQATVPTPPRSLSPTHLNARPAPSVEKIQQKLELAAVRRQVGRHLNMMSNKLCIIMRLIWFMDKLLFSHWNLENVPACKRN